MKVYAGIVTYNPDFQRLAENIAAVIVQVDKVLVFDNASTDVNSVEHCVCESKSTERIELLRNGENGGMAVALNALCEAARSQGADYMLLLDQDSVVQNNMVNELLAYASKDVGIVCPRIVDRNDAVLEKPAQDVEELTVAITSGSLVNLEAWEAVGGYDENLFVDWVDHEFCDNLVLHGYRIVAVNKAVLLHEIGKKEYIGYGWTFEPGKGFFKIPQYSNERPYFRRYDMMRSQKYVTIKYRGTPVGRYEKWMLFAVIVHNLIREKHRFEFVRAAVTGIRDGRNLARAAKSEGWARNGCSAASYLGPRR